MKFKTICAAALIGAMSSAVQGPAIAQSEKGKAMADQSEMIDLFNRWEQVWNKDRFDLAAGCLADNYVRHSEKGNKTVTRDEYIEEVKRIHKERPGIKVIVYDHIFQGDKAWFRFTFQWTDEKTHEAKSQAGMQSYKVENGRLAKTWLSMQPMGSSWTDSAAQTSWTSPPPA